MKISPILSPTAPVPSPLGEDRRPFVIAHRLRTPIWIFDTDAARIVFANAPACELWEAESEKELLSRNMGRDMSSTVEKRLRQYQSDFRDGDARFMEQWTFYPKGEPRSVMVVYSGYELPDGRMAMLCEAIGATEDVPENLRSADALLHTDVMIQLYAQDGPPVYLNPAARKASPSLTNGLSTLFVDRDDYRTFQAQVDLLGEYRMVTKVHTASGERWHDLSAKKCMDAATGDPAVLLTAIDVSELKEARDTARHMADRDQLTGLHNRAFLQSHLAHLSARSDMGQCAVIFFDVDRFKLVNDQYGHETGDTVLQQIALRISKVMQASDIIVRLGGDEFVILVEEAACEKALSAKVDTLIDVISEPIWRGTTRLDMSVSIGVSVFLPQEADFTEVLREADIALYASKQVGRNCATFYTVEMGAAAQARDQLELELRKAIERKEFVLYYQPRLDINSGTIVGVEGLVRWQHPQRGIVMPGDFIDICEETGLIDALGQIVLEIGCKQAIAWHAAGLDINLSVNVSPRQFGDENFLGNLAQLAALPGFPAGKIELEITESLLIGDHDIIAEKLRTINTMGYHIAIDDFGTGFSNLSYISRFPLTCLKIDRSFIDQLPESGPIIQLILTLGKQIGATIVSEGVETQDQLDWLASCDCEQAQGYFIARPLTVDNFIGFLKQSEWRAPFTGHLSSLGVH